MRFKITVRFSVAIQPLFWDFTTHADVWPAASREQMCCLLGNKCDKEDEREVPTGIGQNFAEANGFDYFLETSALNATNVDT